MADASDDGMLAGCLCSVKYLYRTCPRRDNLACRKPYPFMLVLREQLVSLRAVVGLVFLPVRMDPFCDRWRQTVYQAVRGLSGHAH